MSKGTILAALGSGIEEPKGIPMRRQVTDCEKNCATFSDLILNL